jgi:hypothetical protein
MKGMKNKTREEEWLNDIGYKHLMGNAAYFGYRQ